MPMPMKRMGMGMGMGIKRVWDQGSRTGRSWTRETIGNTTSGASKALSRCCCPAPSTSIISRPLLPSRWPPADHLAGPCLTCPLRRLWHKLCSLILGTNDSSGSKRISSLIIDWSNCVAGPHGLNRAAYWQPMGCQRLDPRLLTIGRPKSKSEVNLYSLQLTSQVSARQGSIIVRMGANLSSTISRSQTC